VCHISPTRGLDLQISLINNYTITHPTMSDTSESDSNTMKENETSQNLSSNDQEGQDEATGGQDNNSQDASGNESAAMGDLLEGHDGDEDPEIEAIKIKMKEMEDEAERLQKMQEEAEKMSGPSGALGLTPEEKAEIDARSVFVGNVDYSATADDLERHFHGCGSVNRVTILCDKFTGHPKGFAYIEFVDKDSVETAMALDESLFKGRQIKVSRKRTNRPGISSTNRPPRGRGRVGRGAYMGRGAPWMMGGFRPYRRPFRRF